MPASSLPDSVVASEEAASPIAPIERAWSQALVSSPACAAPQTAITSVKAGAPAGALATALRAVAVRIVEATASGRPMPARAWIAGASASAAPCASISQ